MELSEKPIVFGIMIACVLGIIIVGGFIAVTNLTGVFSGGPFSEVYFDERSDLPNIIERGDEINFDFVVAAHGNDPTLYIYKVTFGDIILQDGNFTLLQSTDNSSERINVQFTPATSTLVLSSEPKISKATTNIDANNKFDTVISEVKVISSNSWFSYPITETQDKYFTYSVTPVADSTKSINLIFDKTKEETFNSNSNILIPIGDIYQVNYTGSESKNQHLSDSGYDVIASEQVVTNNRGTVSEEIITKTSTYRYLIQKIAVLVEAYENSDLYQPTKYEIHFWTVVKEDPKTIAQLRQTSLLE